MSSNIEVQRVCEYCGNTFTARTTSTKYCSKKCNGKHYKKLAITKKIIQSNNSLPKKNGISVEEINKKEILTVKEVATLLYMSLRTVYRLIDNGKIKATNFGERMIRIQRSDLDMILEEINNPKTVEYKLSDCYTPAQVQEKYNISESALYSILRREKIQRIKHNTHTYLPKEQIDLLLQKKIII